MDSKLLPESFDQLIEDAVKVFWRSRAEKSPQQPGGRAGVISGKNLDGFADVARQVAAHCRFPQDSTFTVGTGGKTLPGYFRATKMWDVVVVHQGELIAALEFKSQVDSISNNANNRSEEAIGSAVDLRTAQKNGGFAPDRSSGARTPFLGYLILLEDSAKSTKPVRISSPHFPSFPIFEDGSYADRYRILCERLVEERLYDAASVILSPHDLGGADGQSRSLSPLTDVRRLFTLLSSRLLAEREFS